LSADRTPSTDYRGFLWTALLVVGVWALSWYSITHTARLQGWSERGTFGDMFGAVNSLFSGLAFAGIIWTIILQRRELAIQRREMEQAREESRRIAQASEDAARLSALSQLSAHYGELMKATKRQAVEEIRDSNAPNGVYLHVKDPTEFEHLKVLTAHYKRFSDDLEEIYARLFGRSALGALRWGESAAHGGGAENGEDETPES
jgi:hypothetical protein